MERRIVEVKDQYRKLKGECEATIELLDTLMQNCASHVDTLEQCNSREHRSNLKYFLTISQYQLSAHQKILELNVELEEYLLENQISSYEHNVSRRNSKDSESSSKYHILNSPTTVKCEPPSFEKPATDIVLKLHQHDTISSNRNKLSLPLIDLDLDNDFKPKYDNCIRNDFSTSSVLDDSTSTNNTDIFFDIESEDDLDVNVSNTRNVVIEEDITQESNTLVQSSTSSEASIKHSQVDKDQGVVSYISENLRSLCLVKPEEKYLKSLPKPQMPDIMLKPSDVKRFVILKGNEEEDDEVFLSDNGDVDNLVVKQKKSTKRLTFKENIGICSAVEETPFAVFDIEHRYFPLIGDICMIGHVESPSIFYIQVVDDDSALIDAMASQLAEMNSNTSLLCSSKAEAVKHLGKFCTLALDGTWYRAEVLDWLENSTTDQVYIQLIDYGSQYSVNYKNLRPLPAYCRSHRLAQKCYLAYLFPPGSTKNNKLEKWPIACKEAFLNYCGNIDETNFRITYISPSTHDENAFALDLVRLDDDSDDKSIGDILLEAELAVQIIDNVEGLVKNHAMCNQILSAHGIAGITSDMTQEEIFNIYFNEVEDEPANINEAVMKYNPRDEAETCRNLRRDGTCYKGSLCKWRHDVLRSGFTNDKQTVYWRAFSELTLPVAGQEIMLSISHIVDIHCFYAQIRNAGSGIGSSINDLINIMNEQQMIKKYKKFKEVVPSDGEVVIAKHWNNYWYRGLVRDVDNPDYKIANAEVYFVDFGDILIVPVSDLRNITAEFLELPFQAVECRLHNLRHKQGADVELEKEKFDSKLLGVTLKAHVVAVPGHLQVLLINKDGDDIGLQLIEEGCGELNTELNYPHADEAILID